MNRRQISILLVRNRCQTSVPQGKVIMRDCRTGHADREWRALRERSAVVKPRSVILPGVILVRIVFFCGLLLGLQACGSNGGSNITGGGTPLPVVPTFTAIDAPGAGVTTHFGTIPQEINQSGDVVGYYYDAGGIVHGFIRSSAGEYAVFDAPGAATTICCLGTFAQSINSTGTASGYFVDNTLSTHGFIRTQSGTYKTIDVPGYSGVSGSSINDGGTVVGIALDANSHAHGFIRAIDGSFTTFDAPGVTGVGSFIGTIPERINSQGVVLGYFDDTNGIRHGFLRAVDGTITTLDAPGTSPPCNCGTQPTDFNSSGQIVGITYAAGTTQCFLLNPDGTYTLFTPPGAITSGTGTGLLTAVAINDSGAVVGNYPESNEFLHGFLRNPDGTFTILDDPNATGIGSFGTATTHINSAGAIVGYYGDQSGVNHGFLWQ